MMTRRPLKFANGESYMKFGLRQKNLFINNFHLPSHYVSIPIVGYRKNHEAYNFVIFNFNE